MGHYRMPSPTPSAGSDAPIPETLQEDPIKRQVPPGARTRRLSQAFSEADQPTVKRPRVEPFNSIHTGTSAGGEGTPTTTTAADGDDEKKTWVIFVGNLHPRTTQVDLYELFKGSDDEDMKVRNITIRNSRGCGAVVIPDEAMVPSDRCYASIEFIGWKTTEKVLQKYVELDKKGKNIKAPPILHGFPLVVGVSPADMPDVPELLGRTNKGPFPGTKTKGAGRKIAAQKTELVVEDQPRPLAGPSRRSAQPKPGKKTAGGAAVRRRR